MTASDKHEARASLKSSANGCVVDLAARINTKRCNLHLYLYLIYLGAC